MRSLKLKQRGDTIVEVMMAMMVVGLSLGVAYGIANRATLTGRNAQERTEALKVAEAQIELLKSNLAADASTRPDYTDGSPSSFCITAADPEVDADATAGSACDNVNGSLYSITLEYQAATGSTLEVYKSVAVWDVPSSSVQGRVEIPYRP